MTCSDVGNIVDIFCGAGGLSTGFSKAGFNIVTGVDNNEHSIETFRSNHDCIPVQGDVTNSKIFSQIRDSIRENGYTLEDVDLVIGGPPCRGFSIANSRTDSGEHPLNDLPGRFLEIVADLDPEAVLIENVPRLLTIAEGDYKRAIYKKLDTLGYAVSHGILKAEEFGVPQKRRRVFFIAHKENEVPLPKPDDFEFEYDLPVTVAKAIGDLPELPTGGGGEMEMEYTANVSDISNYARQMRQGESKNVVMNHRTTQNEKTTYRRFKHISQGGNWRDIPEELMSNYSNRARTHDHIYQRLSEDEPAKTVANFRKQMIVHPTQNRLLSVREAARLQSFPDSYHFKGGSFNARQQMVGDAVPVLLAFSIASAIRNYIPGVVKTRSGKVF